MFTKTILTSVVMMGLTLVGSPAWSTSTDTQLSATETRQALQTASVDEHLRLADSAKERFETLESKIEKLQARIDKLTRRPHLDTKGFKRQGLRLWKGKLVNELKETADKVVWHEMQAKEMLASQDKNHKDS